MEPTPPPPPAAPQLSAPAQQQQQQPQPQPQHLSYPDSIDSSPRSRNTDSWDDPIPAGAGGRLRLMCSYGGHIIPRPHDKSLCYVGGETRIVVVDRNTSLADLSARLSKTLLACRSFTLKYQLPSEDLDSLISVTTDEDLDNMIDEYDRTAGGGGSGSGSGGGGGGGGAAKPSRLRLFLFASKPESSQSIGPILDNPAKSEDWFLNALNGAAGMLNRGFSDSASVNCLLGLDDDVIATVGGGGGGEGSGAGSLNNMDSGGLQPKNAKQGNNNIQDVHSVPDSPMLETTSSFGSTSSSPSLAHLPPIRVHVDEGVRALQDQKVGMIEDQFAQMNISGQAGFKPEESGGGGSGFVVLSSPPPMPPVAILASAVPVSSDYVRVISDDERSDHGVPIGYRKPQQPGQPQTLPPPQSQQKSTAVFDLPSPDSVSSDSSFGNAITRPKPVIYHHQQQDPVVQIPTTTTRVASNPVVDPKMNISDPNPRLQLQQQQQNQDSGYVLQPQFEPIQQQQQQQQQPQQFMHHPGAHYIHHHPAGTVPISAYYPVYASQQQQHPPHHHQPIDQQQYPVYYVRQAQQPYNNLSVQQQQPNLSEASTGIIPSSHPQTHPNPAMVPPPGAGYNPVRNAAQMGKPEIATGVYRTATTVAPSPPSLVQVPSAQHHQHPQHQQHQQHQQQQQQQYVGYSQIHHHPSQSVAPNSAANYAYEYADPSHATQIYYTQPLAPTMTSQYQTMTGTAATVVMPEVSGQLSADNMKQQMRTSQPL